MEEHEQQHGTGEPGPRERQDVHREISDLEKVMGSVRESLERIKGAIKKGGEGGEATEQESQASPAEQGESDQGEQPEAGEQTGPDEQAAAGEETDPEAKLGEGDGGAGKQPQETVALFDGTEQSMAGWKNVGAAEIGKNDEGLTLRPGRDRGLAYYSVRRFDDFRLKARYRLDASEVPMTAALRFLDPEKPVPDHNQAEKKHSYDNPAYVAAHTGFEVCLGPGPGGEPGTFAGIPAGDSPGNQRRPQSAEFKSGDWNELEVEARGNEYTVRLNGVETARFTNSDEWRGKPARSGEDAGYVGILAGGSPGHGGQAGRRTAPGPLGLNVPGAVLPGRPSGGKPAASEPAPQAEGRKAGATFQRIEAQVLTPEVSEEKRKLARKDLAAIHEEVNGALARLKAKDRGLEGTLKQAYGYAVLPSVGRASLLLGGARGYGEVFEQGKPIGFTRVTQMTLGVQVGGQTFTQLLLFGSKEALETFEHSPLAFNGNLSAAFIRGASGTTDFKNVTAHAYSRGGMLLEASLGGQKFRFMRAEEAIKELAKKREKAERARAKIANAGQAAKSLASAGTKKAGEFLKKHLSRSERGFTWH